MTGPLSAKGTGVTQLWTS